MSTDLLIDRRLFSKTSAVVGTAWRDIGDIDSPLHNLNPMVILDQLREFPNIERIGGLTKLAFEVEALSTALTDFALLGQAHAAGAWHTLLSGSDWGTVAGILKHKVGALNTLAADAAAMAYVDIGPLYAIKFQAKSDGASIATNGTFTGSAASWDLSGAGLAYAANNVAWSGPSDGVMKQLLASMASPWTSGYIYRIGGTISGHSAGTLNIGTNTNPAQGSVAADGTFEVAVQADAHADGLVFTGDGLAATLDTVTIKPYAIATVRGGLYR